MYTVLRRIREERGYSLRQLAAEVGCTHPTILALEQGRRRRPHPRIRARLVSVLGLPIDVLLMPDTTNAAVLPKKENDGANQVDRDPRKTTAS